MRKYVGKYFIYLEVLCRKCIVNIVHFRKTLCLKNKAKQAQLNQLLTCLLPRKEQFGSATVSKLLGIVLF